jgi:hypothetical protein
MNKYLLKILTSILFVLIQTQAYSQLDSLISVSEKFMPSPYVSDGQQYVALLSEEETAEFSVIFYGGSTYRIVAYNGVEQGISFTMYDKGRNILFSNTDYKNSPYWDFKFENTIECYIEAKLISKNQKSGFAILLIGFKK